MTKTLCWVWLTTALNFGSSSVASVLRKFHPQDAYAATAEELMAAGVKESVAQKLADKSLDRAEAIVKKCQKNNIKIIPFGSPEYPLMLDRLSDKPYVLYVRGDLSCISGKKTAAFIGTRKMSQVGFENAESIAERLINSDFILVSGIAEGVDTVAAKMSLKRNVPTVAVMGVDIDKYYPRSNQKLIDEVAETGAVISEYPPDTGAHYFATRNRIIVGLSDIVNVIEAPVKSGSLIGAKLALKKRIPTYTLDLEGSSFDGCRELIELGAIDINKGKKAVKNTASKPKAPKEVKEKEEPNSSRPIPDSVQGTRRYIWEKLLDGPKTDNSLVDKDHSIQEILCALTELELDGYIKSLPGGKYALI